MPCFKPAVPDSGGGGEDKAVPPRGICLFPVFTPKEFRGGGKAGGAEAGGVTAAWPSLAPSWVCCTGLALPREIVSGGFCQRQLRARSVGFFQNNIVRKFQICKNAFNLVMLLEKYLLPNQCAV